MEKKSVYMTPEIEELESCLACEVAQGVSPAFGEGVEDDDQSDGV